LTLDWAYVTHPTHSLTHSLTHSPPPPKKTPPTPPPTTPQEDLDLYKKANWQRAVSLVLGMLMGGNDGGKAKTAQRLTGFQDPYLGPQWHVIKSNAAVMVKIKCVLPFLGGRGVGGGWVACLLSDHI
jgi:hypothetical protein